MWIFDNAERSPVQTPECLCRLLFLDWVPRSCDGCCCCLGYLEAEVNSLGVKRRSDREARHLQ
jgi:hypothetical protein